MNNLYPIYVILFSNNGSFSKIIRKTTGSNYSHATISLDPSLNEMYSFTDIPYATARTLLGQPAGFVKESIYGPMYSHNLYFTVLITFVYKTGFYNIKEKIEYFVKNHSNYRYNDIGLIKYFFNIKTKKIPNEDKKKKWFCSEFVSYLLKLGGRGDFNTIMQSPQDLYDSNLYVESVDYTLQNFSESDLIKKTNQAKNKFIRHEKNKTNEVLESYFSFYDFDDIAMEINNIFKTYRENRQREWSLMEYTAILDWKYLHDQFIKYFGEKNLNIKFDLIEMIIRKNMTSNNKDITNIIIDEFSKLSKIIGNSKIAYIDKTKINYLLNGRRQEYTMESAIYNLERFLI